MRMTWRVQGAAAANALTFDPDSSRAHTLVGEIALTSGRYADAITSFEQAAALSPSDLWPYMSMAEAHREIGNPEEAIDALMTAVDLAPWLATSWVYIVEICLEQGWIERARDAVSAGFESGALSKENRDLLEAKIQTAAELRQPQDPQAGKSLPAQ